MAALVDLHFADERDRKQYDCKRCPAQTQKDRRCRDPGFENLRKPRAIGQGSLSYPFCPGKATWNPELPAVLEQCRVALEAGILPEEGNFSAQSALFVEVFPTFVERWRERTYQKIWGDVRAFSKAVLEAVFGKKGK